MPLGLAPYIQRQIARLKRPGCRSAGPQDRRQAPQVDGLALFREQNAQVAQIVAGGAGFDGVAELAKEIVGVAAAREVPRIEIAARARSSVSPSATAPAAGLDPSLPSVPALSTAIFFPAIFSTQSSTKAELRPPTPSPVTGELTSPSAMTATRRPGLALRRRSRRASR